MMCDLTRNEVTSCLREAATAQNSTQLLSVAAEDLLACWGARPLPAILSAEHQLAKVAARNDPEQERLSSQRESPRWGKTQSNVQ